MTDQTKYVKSFLRKRKAIIEDGGKQLNVVFGRKHARWLEQLRHRHHTGTYKGVLESLIEEAIKRPRDAGRSK